MSDIASLQRARRGITNQLLSGRHMNRRFVQPTRRKLLVRAAATAAAMSAPPSHAQAPRLANLFGDVDALIDDARKAWAVPGLAIGIVLEGRIAHTGGFGVRKLGEPAAVDGDTVFAIASLTKSFAAATIGQLVDAGRLGWDDRVIDHLPFFALYDDAVTQTVTIRDLLAMRTGISESTNIFRAAALDRTDLVSRMRALKPKAPFREQMIYSTDNYTAAGMVVAEVTQAPWEAYARRTLWGPLGMSRTNTDHRVARSMVNSASPHIEIDGDMTPIPWVYEDHAAVPAGGMNSSAHDMAKWLELLVSNGSSPGRNLISAATVREMMTLQTPDLGLGGVSELAQVFGGNGVQFSNPGYGLGLACYNYNREQIVLHSGVTDGFRSWMMMIPERRFGVVVLANSPHELFGLAIAQMLADRVLSLPDRNWLAALLAVERYLSAEKASAETLLLADTPPGAPSFALEHYTGRYRDGGSFRNAEVKFAGAALVLEAGTFVFDLVHFSRDRFAAYRRGAYPMPRAFFLDFVFAAGGEITGIEASYGDNFVRIG